MLPPSDEFVRALNEFENACDALSRGAPSGRVRFAARENVLRLYREAVTDRDNYKRLWGEFATFAQSPLVLPSERWAGHNLVDAVRIELGEARDAEEALRIEVTRLHREASSAEGVLRTAIDQLASAFGVWASEEDKTNTPLAIAYRTAAIRLRNTVLADTAQIALPATGAGPEIIQFCARCKRDLQAYPQDENGDRVLMDQAVEEADRDGWVAWDEAKREIATPEET